MLFVMLFLNDNESGDVAGKTLLQFCDQWYGSIVNCDGGAPDKMKRIAFFAHYDRDNVIDDYVIYYLRGLESVADRILFVSDSKLPQVELDKLSGIAEIVYADRHREYDFGSWKRCFDHLSYNLAEWDELILANDSCYAPVFPFGPIFDRMQDVECDYWSPTANELRGKFDHLSSYFLVFRRPALTDSVFLDFWRRIVAQPCAQDVIDKYEMGLSTLLDRAGYVWGSPMPVGIFGSFAMTEYVKHTLFRYQSCWIKVRLLRDNPFSARRLDLCLDRISKTYPRELIDAHMRRIIGTSNPPHYHYRPTIFENYTVGVPNLLEFSSKVKRNKKRTGLTWWKIYVHLLRLPVFAFALPIPDRKRGMHGKYVST